MASLTALRPSAERSRRTQLLEAADRLVVRHGPSKTTVADIAKEAGVAVGSVYLEFAGKSEILGALTGWRLEGIVDAMRAALSPAETTLDPAARICDALEARTRAFLDLLEDGCHADSLLHCECEGVVLAWSRFEGACAALVAEGLSAIDLPASDPPATDTDQAGEATAAEALGAEARAEAVLRAYANFAPPGLVGFSPDALRLALRATRALVLNGLRPR